MQAVALLTSLDLHLAELDYVVVSCIVAVILIGITILLSVPLEIQKDQVIYSINKVYSMFIKTALMSIFVRARI